VPYFVEEITAAIEAKGLDMDGLYRISGNVTEVQKLRHQVDHGKYNFKDFDIHVLCGALKTFFRELDDSLIPVGFRTHFVEAMSKFSKPFFVHLFDIFLKNQGNRNGFLSGTSFTTPFEGVRIILFV
jgi:hypothetical protein